MADAKVAFSIYDSKGEGKLDREKVAMCLRACGCNPTDKLLKEAVYPKLEAAGNSADLGCFEDMLKTVIDLEKMNGASENILEEAFKVFDKDGGGTVSSSELRHVMMNLGEKLGEDEITEILKTADANGDAEIDLAEFLKIFKPT
eukprot:gb/GEZN01021049.1/.p1 GENE.gb/GEZN01021049.1/~~gb/GEZN01021049.1/.p1  ORF type:complete len:145 (-),score=36.78 gb/GEZN01021049.1/:118-552(-)